MSKKKLKILGFIISFILCFPIHFLYERLPSFTTSIIAPVNESIFEHMKILFTSIIVSGIIQKIIVIKSNLGYKNVCFSNVVSGILSIPIFLVMFMPVYNAIGKNFPITIIIMLIALLLSYIIGYYILKINKDLKLENLSIFIVIIVYLIFGSLTYYPIKNEFFKDPISNIYGIK